ncbi:UTRA domain-containing protein [Klebsiella pneumoniae subsp. pneumoniae]|nr:UTRA domain-containing protein [Klebsiella pneumoniae subsp. pneumoniae]
MNGSTSHGGCATSTASPLMLEDSYMPVEAVPQPVAESSGRGRNLIILRKECGIIISGNYETLTPVLADKRLARSMNVPEQTPLLRITSLSYSDSG